MPKYKLILLDMDGTIAYTDEMIVQTFYKLYELYNPKGKRPREEIIYFSGPPLSITLPREFPNQDYQFIYDEFIRISKPYYDKYVTSFEDELETLTKLKEAGCSLSVVTNKGHMMAEYVVKLIHLDHVIDYVIGGGDTKESKPHPEGIYLAMSKYGVTKNETIYIGDNDIDYETAHNAGVDSLICTWGPRKLEVLDKCTYKANSYKEIGDILL